jgi:hypothetical protein
MTPADARRIRLVSEGVVASYIHEISPRTGPRPVAARRLDRTRRALRLREDRVHPRRDRALTG